jgi:hypothetical protein
VVDSPCRESLSLLPGQNEALLEARNEPLTSEADAAAREDGDSDPPTVDQDEGNAGDAVGAVVPRVVRSPLDNDVAGLEPHLGE